jgi:hypothetical protein
VLVTRDELAASIADRIADYRQGEISPPTPEHVLRWISQFESDAQAQILYELDYVLARTYYSRARVVSWIKRMISEQSLTGSDPSTFWSQSAFLQLQPSGHSQEAMIAHFDEELRARYCYGVADCHSRSTYLYLDDISFSGTRVRSDLENWIKANGPDKAKVHIVVLALHTLGKFEAHQGLLRAASECSKSFNLRFHSETTYENRMRFRDQSDVLWPAEIPSDKLVADYMASEDRYPLQLRNGKGRPTQDVFSTGVGRRILERHLLIAGVRIRAMCRAPSPRMRPLGFSRYGAGFGSLLVTHRNCPNNAPLALWWGDPNSHSPLSKWYPLFPRKTYDQPREFGISDGDYFEDDYYYDD